MEDVRDLKERQIDALREVANIGAGHAATALSQLTNCRIMISVPQINIARLAVDLEGALLPATDLTGEHDGDLVGCVEAQVRIDAGDGLGGDFLLLHDLASQRAVYDATRLSGPVTAPALSERDLAGLRV